MNNLLDFNTMLMMPESELKTEIVKTFSLFNLTPADETFLRIHSTYIDDNLWGEVGVGYLFDINDKTLFDPIVASELWLDSCKANSKFIDCLRTAKKQGATMVKFFVVVDKDYMGSSLIK